MSLKGIINQIKMSSDKIEDSSSFYLSEIYESINSDFDEVVSNNVSGVAKGADELTEISEESENLSKHLKELIDAVKDGNKDSAIIKIESIRSSIDNSTALEKFDSIIANSTEFKDVFESISKNSIAGAQISSALEKNTTAIVDANTNQERVILQSTASQESAVQSLEQEKTLVESLQDFTESFENTNSEENRREERDSRTKIQEALSGVKEGLLKIKDGFGDAIGAGAKAAGIGGLIALLVKPELLIPVFEKAVKVFTDAINAITGLLNGSTDQLKNFIKENPIVSAVAGIFLVVKTIGAAVAVLGTLATSFIKIKAGMAVISVALGSLGGVFSAVSAGLGALTGFLGVGLLPLIGIVTTAVTAVMSVFNGFIDAVDKFKETGSLVQATTTFLTSAISNFFGMLLDIPKMLVSTIAGWLGFEEIEKTLDSFSFVDAFKDLFDSIGSTIQGVIDSMKGVLSNVPLIGALFKDDNSESRDKEVIKTSLKNKGLVKEGFFSSSVDMKKVKSDSTSSSDIRQVLENYSQDLSENEVSQLKDIITEKESLSLTSAQNASLDSSSTLENSVSVVSLKDATSTLENGVSTTSLNSSSLTNDVKEQSSVELRDSSSSVFSGSQKLSNKVMEVITSSVESSILERVSGITESATSSLRDNQVINNVLSDKDINSANQTIANAISSAVNSISNVSSPTTIINNNGPAIDDILKDKLYRPI